MLREFWTHVGRWNFVAAAILAAVVLIPLSHFLFEPGSVRNIFLMVAGGIVGWIWNATR